MVEAQAGIALPALAQVVPERVDALIAVQFAYGIRPTLLDEPCICRAACRLNQCIITQDLVG